MSRGVGRFDGNEWSTFSRENGLSSDAVLALSADSRGNVWLSDIIGGLNCWDGERWTYFPREQGGRGKEIPGHLLGDRQGRLWFPSKGGVLVHTPVGKAEV